MLVGCGAAVLQPHRGQRLQRSAHTTHIALTEDATALSEVNEGTGQAANI